MATELAAGIATLAIQANQGASIERQISVAIGVATLIGIVWAVVRFFIKPLLHNWLYAVLATEPDRTAGAVVRAMDHNDDTRAVTRRYIDRLYADKIAADTETKDLAEANKDRLVFLEESQARMGESLAKDMGAAMRDFTRSNEQQTQLMREMQHELRKLSEAYVRLDERFNSVYDGPDRRKSQR